MPWWNTERRIRSMTLLGVFGITGGLAFAGNPTSVSHPLYNTGAHAQANTSSQPVSNKTDDAATQTNETIQSSDTNVKVNGETIPLPSNGSVKKTITTQDGSTTIDYSATHTSQSDDTTNSSNSSITMHINASQQSDSKTSP